MVHGGGSTEGNLTLIDHPSFIATAATVPLSISSLEITMVVSTVALIDRTAKNFRSDCLETTVINQSGPRERH